MLGSPYRVNSENHWKFGRGAARLGGKKSTFAGFGRRLWGSSPKGERAGIDAYVRGPFVADRGGLFSPDDRSEVAQLKKGLILDKALAVEPGPFQVYQPPCREIA